jgi:chromosome segregation ATPase
MQCVVAALLAFRMLAPEPVREPASDPKLVAAIEKLHTALANIEARRDVELAMERARAKSEFLDAAFRELKGTEEGAVARLEARFDQSERLAADVRSRDAEIREMRTAIDAARSKLQSNAAVAQREEKRLQGRIDELAAENGRVTAELKKSREELALLAPPASEQEAGHAVLLEAHWWWLGGAALLAIGFGGWWWMSRGSIAVRRMDEQRVAT